MHMCAELDILVSSQAVLDPKIRNHSTMAAKKKAKKPAKRKAAAKRKPAAKKRKAAKKRR